MYKIDEHTIHHHLRMAHRDPMVFRRASTAINQTRACPESSLAGSPPTSSCFAVRMQQRATSSRHLGIAARCYSPPSYSLFLALFSLFFLLCFSSCSNYGCLRSLFHSKEAFFFLTLSFLSCSVSSLPQQAYSLLLHAASNSILQQAKACLSSLTRPVVRPQYPRKIWDYVSFSSLEPHLISLYSFGSFALVY